MSEGVEYCLWPDGTYCERWELEQMALEQMVRMSDDYIVLLVEEWDDDGEPLFPGGLV